MKMNYQSGDKLHSKLGKRLSNRYLSSDAFTSSAGRFGGRTVSKLGSILKKTPLSKRYYGVGQKRSLFEFKNSILKVSVYFALICILAYVLPFTRYMIHGFFTKTFSLSETVQTSDVLKENEAYVSPQFLKTDAFVARQSAIGATTSALVFDTVTNTLIGKVDSATDESFTIVLFSNPETKGSFFIPQNENVPVPQEEDVLEIQSSTTDATASTAPSAPTIEKRMGMQAIIFEGVGYGQLLAKVPPQMNIQEGVSVFLATVDGLQPVAQITHVEVDNGSAFTLVYAQLLTPPTHIYKVRIMNSI